MRSNGSEKRIEAGDGGGTETIVFVTRIGQASRAQLTINIFCHVHIQIRAYICPAWMLLQVGSANRELRSLAPEELN